jgi:hypothetical protein
VKPVNGNAWRRTAGVVVLVLLAGVATTLRLGPRMAGHVPHRLRQDRLVLLSETVSAGRVPQRMPVRTAGFLTVPVYAGALLLLLRQRRTTFGSVPLRRLKLPAGHSQSSDPSD